MELLQSVFFVALLAATSARPMGWRQHQDADIADKDRNLGWPDENSRWFSHSSESLSREDSSESSESRSSEESREDIVITDITTPSVTTSDVGEGSTFTPDVNTPHSDEPTVMESTTPKAATPPCDKCFTVEIPTAAPRTSKRGDN